MMRRPLGLPPGTGDYHAPARSVRPDRHAERAAGAVHAPEAGRPGGALRCNAGDRAGEMSQHVTAVEVLDAAGAVQVRERDELRFADHWSNLDDPVLLTAEFQLEPDDAVALVKRMRKAWIQRKASQ